MDDPVKPEDILTLSKKIRANFENYADRKGWVLNPDKSVTDTIINGLARNKLISGKRKCPCRVSMGNSKESDNDFICPCKDAEKDIIETGHCHCHLFYKK